MRPTAIFAALVCTVAASAALAEEQPGSEFDPENGSVLYESACAECHRSAERLAAGLEGEEEDKRQMLDTFLVDHHAPEEDQRGDIIAYLMGL